MFLVDQTYPTILPNISTETGHIWSEARHVRWTFLAAMFDDCFAHILLTGCPIDPIIFRCIHNFEGTISTLLVGVFITFLLGFGFGV
jgi:hypothetical protein